MEDSQRIVFVSLEHPNQDVTIGQTEYEVLPNGATRAKLPVSVKFNNGRVVFDSIKDAVQIAGLRAHRDYGTFIKELNEDKMRKKIAANSIMAEEVICPYCNLAFPDLNDRNRHMKLCDVKKRPDIIRSDDVEQKAARDEESIMEARIQAGVEKALALRDKKMEEVKKTEARKAEDAELEKKKSEADKLNANSFDEQEEILNNESKSDGTQSPASGKTSVKD